MIGKKINQLATELAPTTTDLTIIGDPISGVSKKITLEQLGAIFGGAVSFYTTLGDFPATGVIDIIYCAKDTKKLYLWSGSAYTEVFPSQALLDTYQLRSEKGNANGYASLDSLGKVPISQLPSSIMEYKGTWSAATNTPTLANGTGDTGDVYICNAAGSVNFGAGAISFAVGDYVVYSGTIWQRSSGAVGTVTSVGLSITGDSIGVTGSPITTSGTLALAFAGTGAQYIKGDGTLATFPTTIAQAQNLITEVYNSTGATLTKGTIVYINGGQGNLPTVTKALATGDSTSAQTYGVVQTDITNMNNGFVVVAGRLLDIDTQAYTAGTQLYLSPTTAGTWTSTKPYAPNHLVYVGIVVRAHPTQGVVEIKIQNGYEMDELHNVAAQNPDNNDILQYKTATSLWTKVAGTTSNIAEGSNLYYTDARSRAALSFTAGSGAYNSTTGVITIPTNTNQLTNGAAFITLASLSAGAGISYNNTTGVIASTITQYTDALARAAISLTTTGTSGAATYNSTTGVLNVPQYAPDLSGYVPTSRTLTINGTAYDLSANRSWSVGTVTSVGLSSATSGVTIGSSPITTSGTITLAIATASGSQQGLLSSTDWNTFNNKQSALTNPVTGTGTTNYLPKFTGTSTIGNSVIQEASSNIGIGVSPSYKLDVNGAAQFRDDIRFSTTNSSIGYTDAIRFVELGVSTRMTLSSGNLGLGVTPSAWGTAGDVPTAFQFGASGMLYSYKNTSSSGSHSIFGANAYFDGSGFKYINTNSATYYRQYEGTHAWFNAPSGTAGNAISFTQAMTLDASGNLGLGTTSPSGYGSGYPTMDLRGSVGSGIKIGNATDVSLLYANSTATYLRTSSSKDLILGTFDTARLTIAASTGAATFSSRINGVVGGTAYNTAGLWLQGSSSTDGIAIGGTGGGDKTIDTYGGTLKINGTAGNGLSVTGAATFSSSVTATLFGVPDGGKIQSNGGTQSYYAPNSGASEIGYQGTLNFRAFNSNSPVSAMFMASNGSIGIGTTSPGDKLDVVGNIALNAGYKLYNGSANNSAGIDFDSSYVSLSGYNGIRFFASNTGVGSMSERMKITSGGNVEIATGSIKTGEPDTGYGRAAFKIGTRQSGTATDSGGYIPISIDGTVYFINLYTSTP